MLSFQAQLALANYGVAASARRVWELGWRRQPTPGVSDDMGAGITFNIRKPLSAEKAAAVKKRGYEVFLRKEDRV
jgi:hypothetical protein